MLLGNAITIKPMFQNKYFEVLTAAHVSKNSDKICHQFAYGILSINFIFTLINVT